MNIVVVGLGSMGKRRIQLIKKISNNDIIYGVDNSLKRQQEATELFGIASFSSLNDIKDNIDVAFICTSPLSHAKLINYCLKKSINVFTEINLVDDMYDENMLLAKNNNLVLFLSSTPMYKKEMQTIYRIFKNANSSNYIYHIGQYLPDWHPWESYSSFFVSDKKTNGCREIMAIEFPWLINLFGDVKSFNVMRNKMSNLNIEYNDNYMIQFEHVNNNKGAIIIDVVSPKGVRKLEVYNEQNYISWDGTADSLIMFDKEKKENISFNLYNHVENAKGYNEFIVENAYAEEVQLFFDIINGNKHDALWTFEQDKKLLSLIDKIEGI